MDLTVITVTWNNAAHIVDQIRSVISAATGITCEQVIVDNASTDQTVARIEDELGRKIGD